MNDLAYSPITGLAFGGSFSLYCDGCWTTSWILFPVHRSSECNLDVGWFIWEAVLVLVGVASSVVELIVPNRCAIGAIAGVITVIVFVSILIVRIINLTFVVGVLNMSLINFKFFIILCLLYTSPSPRDATLSRMPSSA